MVKMDLASQIYIRKSCRKYLNDKIDTEPIQEFISSAEPLIPTINYSYKILKRDEVKTRMNWSAPYHLALYSEKKENYGLNIGFVFQQVSLYLQSMGIGSCWLGLATVKEKDPEFVIMMSFGKSENCTRDITEFKRKELSKISDSADERLKPAQLAPSAINLQPWYFKHTDDGFDVFKVKHNIVKSRMLGKWNDVDVGIALAHLYVSNPETFKFEIKNKEDIKGYYYVGSIEI